jgi:hypothetical protein
MTTPDFNNLTPPDELMQRWAEDFGGLIHAARWGARHGWEQGQRLAHEWLAVIAQDMRSRGLAEQMAGEDLLAMTQNLQPRQPTLQEQALAALERSCTTTQEDRELIRRALEQAGEGVES